LLAPQKMPLNSSSFGRWLPLSVSFSSALEPLLFEIDEALEFRD